MVDYTLLNKQKLAMLAKKRQVNVPSSSKIDTPLRDDFIVALKTDDERNTNAFRFIDLPPKIRIEV